MRTRLFPLATVLVSIAAHTTLAQPSRLERQIATLAAGANGRVSVACALPGTGPMQSVFKVPLALTALHLVEQKKLSLDIPIRFKPEDRIPPHTYSPLQDKYPDANVDLPLLTTVDTGLILEWMRSTPRGENRIKGLLPAAVMGGS